MALAAVARYFLAPFSIDTLVGMRIVLAQLEQHKLFLQGEVRLILFLKYCHVHTWKPGKIHTCSRAAMAISYFVHEA